MDQTRSGSRPRDRPGRSRAVPWGAVYFLGVGQSRLRWTAQRRTAGRTGMSGYQFLQPRTGRSRCSRGTRCRVGSGNSLEAHCQCSFEPPLSLPGTVGGMRRQRGCPDLGAHVERWRNHVLGVNLANGRGEVLTFGGQVAKNVAGYVCRRDRRVLGPYGVNLRGVASSAAGVSGPTTLWLRTVMSIGRSSNSMPGVATLPLKCQRVSRRRLHSVWPARARR